MSVAVSEVISSRLEAEKRAYESLVPPGLFREVGMVVAEYVPEQFEGLALFYDLITHPFFQNKLSLQNFQQPIIYKTKIDKAPHIIWCVFSFQQRLFIEGVLDLTFLYTFHIRFTEVTCEYVGVGRKRNAPRDEITIHGSDGALAIRAEENEQDRKSVV